MVRGMKRMISVLVGVGVLVVAGLCLAQSPSGAVGLVAKPVPRDLARAAGLQSGVGAMVVEVVANGPAAAAGIVEGDLIVSVDGHKVEEPEGLVNLVSAHRPGSIIRIEVVRQGVHRSFRVVVGAPRPGPPRSDLPKTGGACVRA